jgi:hypothetical protein
MKNHMEIPTKGPWPDFGSLTADIVPEWLATSAAEIVEAVGDQIRTVYVELYAHTYYDDNTSVDLKGAAGVTPADTTIRPDEDDLDRIPAMRRIERRADDIWNLAPLDADAEGSITGEFEYRFTRDGFEYGWIRHEYTGEPDFEAEATFVDGEWRYEERIYVRDYEISETDLAINETESIMEHLSPDILGLSTMPDTEGLTHRFDEEDECLVIIAKGGGLFRHHESSVM